MTFALRLTLSMAPSAETQKQPALDCCGIGRPADESDQVESEGIPELLWYCDCDPGEKHKNQPNGKSQEIQNNFSLWHMVTELDILVN